jgi:hypothetical protein
VFIRNQSPLQDHVDLGAKNHMRTIEMKKTYLIEYSALGGGAIEVEAHSIQEAENLFMHTPNDVFAADINWDGGLQIESMSIDDGDQYFEYENGEYQGDDYEHRDEDEEGKVI